MIRNYFLSFLSVMLIQFGCFPGQDDLTVAFWNVENLFDLVDDPLKNDDEFALSGSKKMTSSILELKLDHMCEVLSDLDADILGLCEVENRVVLEMLNNHCINRDYSIIHYDSPDSRGIDVAVLYDSTRFTVKSSRPVPVVLPGGKATRDILYVFGSYKGEDLHLFVNHWPSKYGGVEATIPLRAAAARTLRKEVKSILVQNPEAEIIVMGDLNDEPLEPSVAEHLGATFDKSLVGTDTVILWNLMAPFFQKRNGGTYKYRGEDMVIDHMIVSPGLFDEIGLGVVAGTIKVNDNPKYRHQDGDYVGYPFRFWAGNKLLGGYSDHLAILFKIAKR